MDRQNRQDILLRRYVLLTLSIDENKAPRVTLQVNAFLRRSTRHGV